MSDVEHTKKKEDWSCSLLLAAAKVLHPAILADFEEMVSLFTLLLY